MSQFQVIPHEYNRIVHLHFETQYHLTSSFVRMQEFYESPFPEIRGQVFSLSDFMDRYVASKADGEFTYFTDWAGFNIPGNALTKFFKMYDTNELTHKEWAVFNHVANFASPGDDLYYVIGTYGDSTGYVDHEIAHAYYYLNPLYRKYSDAVYADINPEVKAKVAVGLLAMGYSEDVIADETQAYFATDDEATLRTRFDLHGDDLGDIRERYAKNLQIVRTWKKSPF